MEIIKGKKFKKTSIIKQTIFILGSYTVFLILAIPLGVNYLTKNLQQTNKSNFEFNQLQLQAEKIQQDVINQNQQIKDLFLPDNNPQDFLKSWEQFNQQTKKIKQNTEIFLANSLSQPYKSNLEQLLANYDEIIAKYQVELSMLLENPEYILQKDYFAQQNQNIIQELSQIIHKIQQQQNQQIYQDQAYINTIVILSNCLVILITVVCSVILSLTLIKPMRRIVSFQEFLEQTQQSKKFWQPYSVSQHDEVGLMIDSYNQLIALIQENNLQKNPTQIDSNNQIQTKFFSKMGHDLRSPLNGILGGTEILKLEESLTADQLEIINLIEESANELLFLITNIVDLAKLEAQKFKLMLNSLELNSCCENIAEIIYIKAKNKNIEFESQIQPNLPLIKADEKRLQQILLNLLDNAIKFTEQGKVSFIVKYQQDLEINLQDSSKSVIIYFQIKDTGIGISEEQMNTLYQPFQNVAKIKHHNEGLGLELAISQKLLTLMGSELKVKTKLGQGTTFWFEVPFTLTKSELASKPTLPIKSTFNLDPINNKLTINDDKINIIAPSAEKLNQIYQLVQKGRIPLLLEKLNQIEQLNPQLISFTTPLKKLAEEFEIEQMLDFLAKYLNKKNN